jgi:uncharacterized protein YecT (DUF1311 family)
LNAIGDVCASLASLSFSDYTTDKISMKKSHRLLAALMAVAPSALMATPPLGYGDFTLTKAEVAEIIRVTDVRCPKKSEDNSAIWANEPLYQAQCRSKLTKRSEARLKAAYKRTMARSSKEAQDTLRTEQRLWIETRYDQCARDRDENIGGALKNVMFYDCQLFELKRRTLWIAHPS